MVSNGSTNCWINLKVYENRLIYICVLRVHEGQSGGPDHATYDVCIGSRNTQSVGCLTILPNACWSKVNDGVGAERVRGGPALVSVDDGL